MKINLNFLAPLQGLLKNKKLIMIFAGIIVLVGVSAVAVKVVPMIKKSVVKKKQEIKREEVEAKKQEELLKKSQTPTAPAEVLKRESEMVGEQIKLPEETLEYKPAPRKKITVRKKIKDTPGLVKLLKESITNGDEAVLAEAVRGLEANKENTAALLREEILKNPSNEKARINAVWGLFYTDKSEAISILKTLIKVDPSEDVRIAALFALDGISGDDVIDFMEGVAKDDPSEKVRKKAQEYVVARSIDQ